MHRYCLISQILTNESFAPEAIHLQSGEDCMQFTYWVWPLNVVMHSFVRKSQSFIVESTDPDNKSYL